MEHQKEHYFTLKKIRNREKKEKKPKGRASTFRLIRAKPTQDAEQQNPPKLLNPFPFHRAMSDLIIFDDLEALKKPFISPIHSLINLKHISSIDHHNDFISLNLEDPWNYPVSPLELLIARLSSLGNSEAFILACALTEYINTFELILKAKSVGNFKPNLDILESAAVNLLKEYFCNVIKNSISEEDWWNFFSKFQSETKQTPSFCMIFSEFRPTIGLQLKHFIMNNAFKKMIPCDDLNIIDDDFLCLDTKEYFNIITETIKKMYTTSNLDNGSFYIKTKIGFRKMNFNLRKFYINTEKLEKKVAILFSLQEDGQLEEIYNFLKTLEKNNVVEINNVMFKKSKKKMENNEKWNELIELYFIAEKKKEEMQKSEND